MSVIWDIGHSNRNLEDFLKILKKNNIELIIDVRRFPSSKKFPHFDKENLKAELKKSEIDYLWLGEKLGGFRKEGYEKWLTTKDFHKGLEILKSKASQNRTAIMCAEGYFRRCHRRYILELFEKNDWQVVHL